MNHFIRLTGYVMLGLIGVWTAPAAAQSNNRQAKRWYEVAKAERDSTQKIAAYAKAIELDTLFVEAFFELGLLHKAQKDYPLAEQYMQKAFEARPEKQPNDFRFRVAYELAAVYGKLEKPREQENMLQRAQALAVKPSQRGLLAFELGRLLYENGRYQEALDELKTGRRQYPENQVYFDNLIAFAENAVEVEALRENAEQAKRRGNLQEAQVILLQIKSRDRRSKNVEKEIVEIDSLLRIETANRRREEEYQKAQRWEKEGKLETAIVIYEKLLRQAGQYKDAAARLQRARQQLAQKQNEEQLEREYQKGLAALQARQWARAVIAFEKIRDRRPDYRDVSKRLEKAEKNLDAESEEAALAHYYAEGESAMNKGDLGGALAAFEKVTKRNPKYRDAAGKLAQVEKALQPNLHGGSGHLARETGDRRLDVKGVLVVLGVFALFGFIAWPRAMRARVCLLLGKKAMAARLYEEALSRHPERMRLYSELGNIYLLLRRRDERALRVYEKIVKMNLATTNFELFNSIIGQKAPLYIGPKDPAPDRADSGAIAVLEKSLQDKSQTATV